MKLVNISEVKPNPKNPRIIKDVKFNKLVTSIKEFPDMLNKRPLIVFTDVDNKYIVLGGNMRLKACKEIGLKEIPIIVADEWTEEQKNEFLIKDNVGFGEWDWDSLANEWDSEKLDDWGLNVPEFSNDIDYSILDDEDLADDLLDMANGVKKAIQIEFEAEHYESAYELVKFWREREAYVGGMIMEYLKAEKEKL
jgi:ParB-like chromosome segregation protein Spo0J